ncbi:MAG: endonuclease [Saprospiraceae bacterium]|nr:endonuclease [Saprospiraceae bacterium]
MRRLIILLGINIFCQFIIGQTLVINELDCDTPGIDDKEFVELRSEFPDFPLDGYVLVFFNGSAAGANTSYLTLPLDGYKTDINGIFLIGSTGVSPFPQYIIPPNVIQNGADAVALYRGTAEDFPEGTLAIADQNLIDVLIYGTNDPIATGLIEIFRPFKSDITQINEGNANNSNSIQRNNDGTYTSKTPTPRKPNDGSGIILNGILIHVSGYIFNEGDSFEITFTTEQKVDEDLQIDFTLTNGTFNTSDYSGLTNLVIPKDSTTVSTLITLISDEINDGDELMIISLGSLPVQYLKLNNELIIRVVDNDFRVADFGTPINPTYGKVNGTQPEEYYSSLNGKKVTELRNVLQSIIANPEIVRAQTYNDVIDVLKEADQNPENSNQVWLVYLEKGLAKLDFQLTSDNLNTWNREHTWPRSRGGFNSIEADETIDGPDIFWMTNADSTRHANSDVHAIRAADGPENSKRGNQFYGEYNGPAGTLGGFKGDVARGIFYLDIRYNGLEVVNGFPESQIGKFGDLATLLEWHRNDPPDDFEMNRNNVVYQWQKNRNPFIDNPQLAEYLWGNKIGEVWQNTSSAIEISKPAFRIYPNPANNNISIEGVPSSRNVEIYSLQGERLLQKQFEMDMTFDLNLKAGLYLVKISTNTTSSIHKLIVE